MVRMPCGSPPNPAPMAPRTYGRTRFARIGTQSGARSGSTESKAIVVPRALAFEKCAGEPSAVVAVQPHSKSSCDSRPKWVGSGPDGPVDCRWWVLPVFQLLKKYREALPKTPNCVFTSEHLCFGTGPDALIAKVGGRSENIRGVDHRCELVGW
jgi:hypothetical protein